MSKRKVYLQDIALDEAWRRFDQALEEAGLGGPLPGAVEQIPVAEALGRVTAAPIWAQVSSPHYHASAMDGYAVQAADTVGATETTPVRLRLVEAGLTQAGVPRPAQAVNTGHPLPLWANAVIMIENVQHMEGEIEIMASAAPYQHVRPLGEDMVATELVLPANHTLRPVDLGAIAGCGHARVAVRRKPRVAVIPTGSELVSAAHTGQLRPGDIIEYNSIVMAAQVLEWGGQPTRWPIVPDEFEAIQAAVIEAAADHDLVLVNAGSSAGSEDYTARVVQEVGKLLVHGVAVRPGHPVILGMVNAPPTPIVGVPGYPVSAALTGEIFVERVLARWLGRPPLTRPRLQATLTRKVQSPPGDDEFMRVAVGRVGERTVAAPLSRGAGVITSLVRADGIVRIPRFSEGEHAGAEVTVELYRDPAQVERTVVAIGSQDLVLDLLAQFLAERAPGTRLASANAGSMGGLVALRRGEAHLAGSHLLHPESGTYNLPYVQQYLPDQPVVLVTLVRREQGLIVAPGNPQGLRGLADLTRPELRYVNRQRGAGTRVLLDYRLGELGIDPAAVQGYAREEVTHLAVAAAVASGVAACGLGIRAAARALELDFVPVEWERYDLVIPREHYESALLEPLLTLLHDADFRAAVAGLPGYDAGPMGEVVYK
ncbi:MAG: molybdopterin biosynthesis protein [Anaerolineae bacterium]|jgi:putative molybdopterin biosynthesis protein